MASIGRFKSQWVVASFMMLLDVPLPAKARRSVGCYAQAHGPEAISAHTGNPVSVEKLCR
jgi:hypothetical protein